MACSCTICLGTKLTLLTACRLSTCTQSLQRRVWPTIATAPNGMQLYHLPWHQADPPYCLQTFHLHTVVTKEGLANHSCSP
jgi:hypothetical protein